MTARRRGPSEHVLIAGDESDLPAICHLLWLLPDDAYGNVIIETLTDEPRDELPTPDRVTVTWLTRSERASLISSLVFADHGEPLALALAAWAAEWLAEGDERLAEKHLLWIGAAESRHVGLARELLLQPRCNHVYLLGESSIELDDGAASVAALRSER